MHLSFLPGVALSVTATILVGQYIGAKDLEAAARSARTSMKIGALIMGSISLTFVLLRHPLAALFSRDPAVQQVAANLFFFVAVFQTIDAVGTVSSGAIRGAGDTRWPMVVSILLSWFVFVPSIFLLGGVAGLGVYGAWCGATFYILLLAALMYGRFRRGKWKTMKI
jgi:Na+-driven multidrug efflux pump